MKYHLTNMDCEQLGWNILTPHRDITFTHISSDTRELEPHSIFFIFDGEQYKTPQLLDSLIHKTNKIQAIFMDSVYESYMHSYKNDHNDIAILVGTDFHNRAASTLNYIFSDPSNKIHLLGVTGTNGKTSIALYIHQALKSLNKQSIYIGTLSNHNKKTPSVHHMTTPDLITLHKKIHDTYHQGNNYVAMEVSSHALEQNRIAGLNFDIGIFTNLSQDHLDYHLTLEQYFLSKQKFFIHMHKQVSTGHMPMGTIICTNNPYGMRLLKLLKKMGVGYPILSIGIKRDSTIHVHHIHRAWSGYNCTFTFNQQKYHMQSKLLGEFNIFNLLSVFLSLYLLGFTPNQILKTLSNLHAITGRIEVIYHQDDKRIIIDYAHTPNALENILHTISELHSKKLSVLFGCGGNRDTDKRKYMGKIASQYANHIYLTSDNPRNESPLEIIEDIKEGIQETQNCYINIDRKTSIQQAIQNMVPGETLMILGKGHEISQIIQGEKIPFSDHQVVKQYVGY